ncbi:conjugal transfer protein [Bacteroidia bacterium]|nr:conjugal transfer protein [Bacteroidia bacterium]
MKRLASSILYALLLLAMLCACNGDLEVKQDYSFHVETLPLPKKLKIGETVALEFTIVREGKYAGTTYKFRYFQSEGAGLLSYKGLTVPKNRFQNIAKDDFVLSYQCTAEEQQQLDFVFEDNFGQRVEYTITFASARTEKEE